MFSKLPDAVVCAIFESTSSLSASAKLARCSRRLSGLWRAHLATLNLAHTFDDDPRWRGPKYRFFAVSIARATLEDGGEPQPTTNEAVKAGYRVAGIVNATAAQLLAELRGEAAADAAADAGACARWLEYVLVKTLYMLWLAKLTGAAPCDSEFWVDADDLVAFLLQARWQRAGYPSLLGVRGVTREGARAPVRLVTSVCVRLDDRVRRIRRLMGADWSDGDDDGDDGEEKLPLDFYDDTDLDDMEFGSDEGEFESDGDDDDAQWADDGEEHGYHKGYADEE